MNGYELMAGALIAIPIHEAIHYVFLRSFGARLKGIMLSVYAIVLYTQKDEGYLQNNPKLVAVYLIPFFLGLALFPFYDIPFVLGFSMMNVFGGSGDVYYCIKALRTPKEKRKESMMKDGAKLFNSIQRKKYLKFKRLVE